MKIFLFLSVFPLVLTGGMVWLVRGLKAYPEQRGVGVVLCLFLATASYGSLRTSDLSVHWAALLVFSFSLAGFFLDTLLSHLFKDPAKAPIE